MTLASARRQFGVFERMYDQPQGFCFSLAVDASLRRHELPIEWYDYFQRQNISGGSWNQSVSRLLREYFGVEPQYNGHPVAKFTSFYGSPQAYMPDAPYGEAAVPDDVSVEQADGFRLRSLLEESALRCNIVLANLARDDGGDHSVALLRLTDFVLTGDYYPPEYAVVDPDFMELGHYNYDAVEFSRLDTQEIAKPFAPLPNVRRRNAAGQEMATWELIVLPSAPRE